MPPLVAEIALEVVRALIKYGPDMASKIQRLFLKPEPTQADWDDLFASAREPWKDRKPDAPTP